MAILGLQRANRHFAQLQYKHTVLRCVGTTMPCTHLKSIKETNKIQGRQGESRKLLS